jgi:hypothetical protein
MSIKTGRGANPCAFQNIVDRIPSSFPVRLGMVVT